MIGEEFSKAAAAHALWVGGNPEGRRLIARGVVFPCYPFFDLNLAGCSLCGSALPESDFTNANLNGANLSGCDLSAAKFRGTLLRGAILSGAILRGANFRGAIIAEASFRGATIAEADFREAIGLETADFRGAVFADNKITSDFTPPTILNLDALALAIGEKTTPDELINCYPDWVVEAAGAESLAKEFGRFGAAALVYLASTGIVPNLNVGHAEAIEQLTKRAALQPRV